MRTTIGNGKQYMPSKTKILVVDDDQFFANYATAVLGDRGGYQVMQALTVGKALDLAREHSFRLVVTDLKMQPGTILGALPAAGGHNTGIALAREIRKLLPNVKIIVHTNQADVEIDALTPPPKGVVYQYKTRDPDEFLRSVRRFIDDIREQPRAFIVHGSATTLVLELKNYLQNRLGFQQPTVLAEQANAGQTMIEKFEHYAAKSEVAFVLLTPDDVARRLGDDGANQMRARQNVIFELGFFFGLMRRSSGRIVVLHKGPLEIPSDLAGVAYIDISHGIEASGEQIRKEVETWAQRL